MRDSRDKNAYHERETHAGELRRTERATAEGLAQVANMPGEVHPLDPYQIEG